MKLSSTALAALLVAVILAAGALAARGALRFTPAINDPRPPLAQAAPIPASPLRHPSRAVS